MSLPHTRAQAGAAVAEFGDSIGDSIGDGLDESRFPKLLVFVRRRTSKAWGHAVTTLPACPHHSPAPGH